MGACLLFKVLSKYILVIPAIVILWVYGIPLVHLGESGFDDTVTLHHTILALENGLQWVLVDVHTIFFNIVILLHNMIFGSSLFGNHIFSLILATVTLMYFYKTMLILGDGAKRIAPLATAALASSNFLILYSTQGRTYPLLLLMSLTSFYYMVEFIKGEKKITVFVIVTTLLLFTHLVSLIQIVGQLSLLYLYKSTLGEKKYGKLKYLIISLTLSGCVIAILFFLQYKPSDLDKFYAWIDPVSMNYIYRWFNKFSLKNDYLIGLHLLLIASSLIKLKKSSEERLIILLLISWMILPPVILTIKSKYSLSIMITRGYITSLIPFYILTGVGVAELDRLLKVRRVSFQYLLGIILIINSHRTVEGLNLYSINLKEREIEKKGELILYFPQMMSLNIAAKEAPECIGQLDYVRCLEGNNIYNFEKALSMKKENNGEIILYIYIDDINEFKKYKKNRIDKVFKNIIEEKINKKAQLFTGHYL